jgi:peptidoglycan hydrolase-like protein with peptidoglycan-binding domain
MPGFPSRDLAVLDPWEASYARSRARRERAGRSPLGRGRRANGARQAPPSLSALLGTHRQQGANIRDLAETEPWDLSLGRSRARRRAEQLRFVPTGTRARRVSLGALVALMAGPSASLAEANGAGTPVATGPAGPPTTTEHNILLLEGSEGRQVKLLQKALGDVKVDGVFGPETEAAVEKFQEAGGLTVDGVVGPLTSAALRTQTTASATLASFNDPVPGEAPAKGSTAAAADAAQALTTDASSTQADGSEGVQEGTGGTEAGQSAATNDSSETSASTANVDDVVSSGTGSTAVAGNGGTGGTAAESSGSSSSSASSEGATWDAVTRLQAALHVTPDGDFGPETEAAVRRLQARNGLTVDGIVGPQTWNAIGVNHETTLTPPPSAMTPAPGAANAASTDTDPGTGGTTGSAAITPPGGATAVEWLQAALHLPVNGEFGPETEAAVRALQARNGLTVDGIVGPQTWNAIGVKYEETLTPPPSALTGAQNGNGGVSAAVGQATNPATGAPVAPPVTSADAVVRLQAALHVQVDGEFGPETEAAVRRLQARHGLNVDGVVGPSTWSVIGVSDGPTLTPPPSALVGAGSSTSTPGAGAAGGESSSAGGGEGVIARVIAAADEIATRPYVYGGGHGSFESVGYDCSGSVSYALHGGGLLSSPEDSSELESYGEPGPGKYITIYANAEHAYMTIDGRRFDTVALQEDGSRWSNSPGDDGGDFVERHPDGL